MGTPTRFNNGITNNAKGEILDQLIQLDPTTLHTYFEDFDYYNSTDWGDRDWETIDQRSHP